MIHGCAYMYIHFQEKALNKKNYDNLVLSNVLNFLLQAL